MAEVDPDEQGTRYAVGAGLMLLASVLSGLLLATLVSRFVGNGTYITFLMPALIGWLVGSVAGMIAARMKLTEYMPLVLSSVLGTAIAYCGYHLLAYLEVMEFLVQQLTTMVDRAASNPAHEVMSYLEGVTGERGVMAYLAFTSTGLDGVAGNGAANALSNASISPVGLIAGLRPGLGVVVATIVVEFAIALAVTVWSSRFRSGIKGRRRAARRVDEVVARTDDEGVIALMKHIERGSFEAAGQGLATTPAEPTHAIVLSYLQHGVEPWRLKIFALGSDGSIGHLKTERKLDSFAGQALLDELRLRRRETGA